MKKKYSVIERSPIIQIFKKHNKSVFCEIEVPDDSYLKDLQVQLNSTARFILFGDLLIDKSEIDYIIFKNN